MSFWRVVRFLPALACMAAIFWLSGTPGEPLSRAAGPLIEQAPKTLNAPVGTTTLTIEWLKVGHFVGYAALGAALLYGFTTTTRHPQGWALGTAALYAVSDELHQALIPGRHGSGPDIVLDTGAAAFAILLLIGVRRWKRKAAAPATRAD